jgi:glycosyltransferase involved in cell wall biosynthesis
MRIAIVCPRGIPPVVGGAERLWEGMARTVNVETEHHAELAYIDSPEGSFRQVVDSYLRFSELDFADFDVVVSGKYPAWMVRHRRHVIYLCHPLRGLYDTYNRGVGLVPSTTSAAGRHMLSTLRAAVPGTDIGFAVVRQAALEMLRELDDGHPDLAFPGPLSRSVVHWLDSHGMHPTRISRYAAISPTVARRPEYFPLGISAEVVIPPTSLDGLGEGEFSNFFTASRLDRPKRIDLLIRAMEFVDGDRQLRIAGSGPEEIGLRKLAGNDKRIVFLGGVSNEQLANEYSQALAVPFVPDNEDLGLITIEAQRCAKPVVTCHDSGGVLDLVSHGSEGLVVSPDPAAIGAAMNWISQHETEARAMGQRGAARSSGIAWGPVRDLMLTESTAETSPVGARQRIVALSTYAASPARHGGQVRVRRLLEAVSAFADVQLVVPAAEATSGQVCPGFEQIAVAPSADFYEFDHWLSRGAGVPTTDIALSLDAGAIDDVRRVIAPLIERADLIVLCHPYLLPAIPESSPVPIVYDAHNVEAQLKASMYADTPFAQALASAVGQVERRAVQRAALVTSVSDQDVDVLSSAAGTMSRFVVIPNGGDFVSVAPVLGDDRSARRDRFLELLRASGLEHDTSHLAVFLASAHPPNLEAARWVIGAAQRLPEVTFLLAGSHADAVDVALPPNVIARGMVGASELNELLRACDVALNPMLSGSGTNIKMLDYFAAGAPVVATEVGARGLGADAGVHYTECRASLVTSIRQVLDRPEQSAERASRAHALAATMDWSVIGRRFSDEVLAAIAARSGGAAE